MKDKKIDKVEFIIEDKNAVVIYKYKNNYKEICSLISSNNLSACTSIPCAP